jgi:succinoglycan biosynthesis transport protein ExoP
MVEYEKLRESVQRLQTLRDKLWMGLSEVDLQKSFNQEALAIFEDASMGAPIVNDWRKSVFMGVLFGLGAGLILVYLVQRIDDRVLPSNDLSGEFQLSIVGRVPEVKLIPSPDKLKALPRLRDRQLFTESYRNIRSSLLFMPVEEKRPKIIIITSAVPYEGKSTVCLNLAETLAFAGCRVLLIDADLRRGQIEKHFQVPSQPGLSDLLQGQTTIRDVVVQTAQNNLSFIPTGKPCVSPGELFLSPVTDAVLKDLSADYDFILIDTPPILAADDTTSLAPKADGVLFIVRESFTKSGLMRPAIDQLLQRRVKVLGLIVNRADSSSKEYCYYKYAEYYASK